MKTFEFTYVLVGTGETKDEALADALEGFDQFPGEPTSTTLLYEED